MRYVLAHPDKVAALVLIDAAGAPITRKGAGNIGFAIARIPGVNLVARSITPRWLVERSLRQSVAVKAAVTPAMVDRYWELLRYPGNREATFTRLSRSYSRFAAADLVRINAPTLIEWGDKDPLIGPDGARFFASAIPGSSLLVYPGVGHLPMEEAPARSAADMIAFLGRHAIGAKAP